MYRSQPQTAVVCTATPTTDGYFTFGPGRKPCSGEGIAPPRSPDMNQHGALILNQRECVARCNTMTDCNGVSWNLRDHRCYPRWHNCNITGCVWQRWDGRDTDWQYFYRCDSCPTLSPTQHQANIPTSGSTTTFTTCTGLPHTCSIVQLRITAWYGRSPAIREFSFHPINQEGKNLKLTADPKMDIPRPKNARNVTHSVCHEPTPTPIHTHTGLVQW